MQAERSAWLSSIHVRAAGKAVTNARVAISPLAMIALRSNPGGTALFRPMRGVRACGSVVTGVHYATQTMARSRVRPKKSDIICPSCSAVLRRVELVRGVRTTGEYRCLSCDHVLEMFEGTTEIAIRLTVQPERTFQGISH